MKKLVAIITLTTVQLQCLAQCTFAVKLQGNGNLCLGSDTLSIVTNNTLYSIAWYTGGILDTTVYAVTKKMLTSRTVAGGNGKGAMANQFSLPNSVCFDANANRYVADLFNYRIQKFPPGSTGSSNGTTVAGGNGLGKATNQFQPSSVFVDGNGYIYVADNTNSRILQFPPNATGLTNGIVIAGGNGQGPSSNQFSNPVNLFVDVGGNLYVVDALNDRIQKFSPGNTNGVTVAGGNGVGSAANQFNAPNGIFVANDGTIYIADAANNRIQKFAPQQTNGVTVAGGNGFGSAANQLATPSSVWVDGSGNVYVADVNNQRIQAFPAGSTSSTDGITVAGGNGLGVSPNQFSGPVSVVVDGTGNIYVADIGNYRVQEFLQPPVIVSTIDTIYIPSTQGNYYAVVTDSAGCTVTTNSIGIGQKVQPTIVINASAASAATCPQTLDTLNFTATVTNGGTVPVYQWQVNGKNVGVDKDTFTAHVSNGDIVTCTLTSNSICSSPASVTSQGYKATFGIPPSVSLTNATDICQSTDTLKVHSNTKLSTIIWYNGAMPDTTQSSIDTIYTAPKPGVYTALVIDMEGCSATTNPISIVSPAATNISIVADHGKACSGTNINFTAIPANAGLSPFYKWLLNGNITGMNIPQYNNSFLKNGDAIKCILSKGASCIDFDTSNTIVVSIKPLPIVGPATDVSIPLGQSTVLNMPITGNILSYLWSPVSTLSNNSVATPIASPTTTTIYTLKVLSTDNCPASDSIKVSVYSNIYIPTGFTPNGDGRNDVFYLIGGLAGDKIKDFSVFDRWGKRLFQLKNALPNDEGFGWNGTCNGIQQPQGSYIYSAVVVSANGMETQYKGTVILLR